MFLIGLTGELGTKTCFKNVLIDVVSLHYHITECGPGQAVLEMCCQCMKVNYGPVFGPAEIIGQLASVKMALIVASPISKQQLDPLVYA